MRMPGFIADAALLSRDQDPKSAARDRRIPQQPLATRHSLTITPQFSGSRHCYWRCYPGSGCEYVCQYFPY
jgi:hypothetical protein